MNSSARFVVRKSCWILISLDIYGIPTFRFNEAIKRNRERFPEDFMFRLTAAQFAALTSQFAMSKKGRGGRRTLPYAFTEHGAVMAANILNSPRAVQMSVFVVRAFLKMRALLGDKRDLAQKLASLEKELKKRLDVHEAVIVTIMPRCGNPQVGHILDALAGA